MEYIQIGFTKKTHGVGGELKIAIDEIYEDLFFECERILIEVRGSKMPYFIKNIRGGGDIIVHFEDVDNKNEALMLQSKPVFLPSSEVPASLALQVDDGLEFGHIVGFEITDTHTGIIGTIEEIVDMPHQEMALVQYKGREVLLPLNETLIKTIDIKQKTILVDLPDGLLDL